MLKFTVQNKRQQQQLLTKGAENESKEISGEHEEQNRAKKDERNNNDGTSVCAKGNSNKVTRPGKSPLSLFFVFSCDVHSRKAIENLVLPQPQKFSSSF